ncbi:uncharacterized protein BJ171DRAFT_309521 [Polychytrium aggregatum]|uniref:uncharacterized protein n=1 Tax=Polychytrium aggregatum TaxID=110093 RepID=UPI0022FDCEA2|nr:uncharacterized protein BJ171DRAFT_309521 [Polychytrium aggregatum]KAI9206956.1 hypothetical protein BJ171DRAFT_309521 [Polychytrium aggregatum]
MSLRGQRPPASSVSSQSQVPNPQFVVQPIALRRRDGFVYPSCTQCLRKLSQECPSTYSCNRCRSHFPKANTKWTYYLTFIGHWKGAIREFSVFGSILDPIFGMPAGQLVRQMETRDLTQQSYIDRGKIIESIFDAVEKWLVDSKWVIQVAAADVVKVPAAPLGSQPTSSLDAPESLHTREHGTSEQEAEERIWQILESATSTESLVVQLSAMSLQSPVVSGPTFGLKDKNIVVKKWRALNGGPADCSALWANIQVILGLGAAVGMAQTPKTHPSDDRGPDTAAATDSNKTASSLGYPCTDGDDNRSSSSSEQADDLHLLAFDPEEQTFGYFLRAASGRLTENQPGLDCNGDFDDGFDDSFDDDQLIAMMQNSSL